MPIRLAIAGTVALVAALAAWSLGGEPADAAERRLAIANMTEAERSQLKRKYEDLQRLSASERESIRQIHAAVEQDPALMRTLLEYDEFVSGLDPWDQAELRQLEPAERINRVEVLTAERDRRNRRDHPAWLAGRVMPGTIYPPHEFEQAMQLVAESLALPQKERDDLEKLPPHERHLAVARRAAEKVRSGGPKRVWPDPATADRLLTLLPDGWLKGRLLQDDQSPADKQDSTLGLLMRSLVAEWQTQAVEQLPPDALRAALDSLPEREQAELQQRDPNELLRQVMQALAKQEGDTGQFAKRFLETTALWQEFDRFARGGRRGPGRQPFGPPERRGFGPEPRDGDRNPPRDDDRRRRDDRNGPPGRERPIG